MALTARTPHKMDDSVADETDLEAARDRTWLQAYGALLGKKLILADISEPPKSVT